MRVAGVLGCLFLTASLSACATALPRGSGWVLLGERGVDFRVDHDAIDVGRRAGRFSELRFVARGDAIEVRDMRVVLGDGDFFSPNTRLVFERGDVHVLHLPGGDRVVRRVEFVYRSLHGRHRRAVISVYGR